MNVTWRQQIVAYCVLFVARMFADDPQLVQDIRNLSNRITTQKPDEILQPPMAQGISKPPMAQGISKSIDEFQVTSVPE